MPATRPHPHPTHGTDDTQYYRQVLHDLIDMGTDLARLVHAQATREPAPNAPAPSAPAPAPAPAPTYDPTLAFDRIARCVRRCVALARRLAQQHPPPAHAAHPRAAARKRIIRDVEDAIHRTADGPQAESLRAEFATRLDAPDLDDDVATRRHHRRHLPRPRPRRPIRPGPLEAPHPGRRRGPLRPRRRPVPRPVPRPIPRPGRRRPPPNRPGRRRPTRPTPGRTHRRPAPPPGPRPPRVISPGPRAPQAARPEVVSPQDRAA